MKEKIINIVILTICFSHSFGQFNLGFNAGLNISSLSYGSGDNNSSIVNFNAGLTTQYSISERLFIRAILLYSIKGYSSLLIPQGTVHTRLNYILIPTLLGVNLNRNFAFLLGPEFCILTHASMKTGNDNTNRTNNFEKFDLGLDVAVLYNFNRKFGIELLYNYGFIKVERFYYYDTNGNVTGFERAGKNRVFAINLIYNLKS